MKKNENLIFRVTPEEKKDFERAAEISGLSLSAWIRLKLRAIAAKELKDMGEDVEFLKPNKNP
ncbi:MAG: hypothetical protein JNL57_02125 [Bacteroidetes bacterium]|nr:hypothetical protein [Bacteroidota bacterium]